MNEYLCCTHTVHSLDALLILCAPPGEEHQQDPGLGWRHLRRRRGREGPGVPRGQGLGRARRRWYRFTPSFYAPYARNQKWVQQRRGGEGGVVRSKCARLCSVVL